MTATVAKQRWLGGIRGTVVMILTWTVGWALGFGGLIEAFVDPSGKIIDIWFTTMAIPGFGGGALYSALLRIAERGHKLHEVPLVRTAAWGAVTGLALGVFAVATVLAHAPSRAAAVMIGIATGLGAVSGIASAVFFRVVGARLAPTP
jgi:hypothetical protein